MARLFSCGFEGGDGGDVGGQWGAPPIDSYNYKPPRSEGTMPCLCWWHNYLYMVKQSLRNPWDLLFAFIGLLLAMLMFWMLEILFE